MLTRRFLIGAGVTVRYLLPSGTQAAAPARPPVKPARPPAGPPPLVVLDPGHGGKDPGAVGITGTYEKHIALAAAQELQRQLMAGGRYRVELTRTSDVFIPLDQRVIFAQRHGAALFVSMHADALTDHSVRGASVYTNADSASDAQTAALAQRENAVDRLGVTGFRDAPPEVRRILGSLVRQETRQGSARMAHGIVGAFAPQVPLLQNPARHARFMVLQASDIPSILVEMGFMSNKLDEAALRQPGHRARIATAMRQAVDNWFAAQPGLRPNTAAARG